MIRHVLISKINYIKTDIFVLKSPVSYCVSESALVSTQ